MNSLFIGVSLIAALMMICEALFSRQKWPKTKSWVVRAVLFNGIQVVMIFTLGKHFDNFIQPNAVFTLSFHPMLNIALGYIAITFVYYWWHRVRHTGKFWDYFHQLHHSPQRLEILTTFYKHPLEIFINTLLSSTIIYALLGLDATCGAIVIGLTGGAELFYHWNVKTPYWLGFIFQRPESHAVHHARGKHYYNFSDLPLWDILFGTFHNPKEREFECGFDDDKELKIIPMLSGNNVNLGEL